MSIRFILIAITLLSFSAAFAQATPQCQGLDRSQNVAGVTFTAQTSSCTDSYTDAYGASHSMNNQTQVSVTGLPEGYSAGAGASSYYYSYDSTGGWWYYYGSHAYYVSAGSSDYAAHNPSFFESASDGQSATSSYGCSEGLFSQTGAGALGLGDNNYGGIFWGDGTGFSALPCTSGDVQQTLP